MAEMHRSQKHAAYIYACNIFMLYWVSIPFEVKVCELACTYVSDDLSYLHAVSKYANLQANVYRLEAELIRGCGVCKPVLKRRHQGGLHPFSWSQLLIINACSPWLPHLFALLTNILSIPGWRVGPGRHDSQPCRPHRDSRPRLSALLHTAHKLPSDAPPISAADHGAAHCPANHLAYLSRPVWMQDPGCGS